MLVEYFISFMCLFKANYGLSINNISSGSRSGQQKVNISGGLKEKLRGAIKKKHG